MTPDIANPLAAPEFGPIRLPVAALSAIAEKLGRARALEYADGSDDETKCAALFLINVTRALALMKDHVNASSEDDLRRVRRRLGRALAEIRGSGDA